MLWCECATVLHLVFALQFATDVRSWVYIAGFLSLSEQAQETKPCLCHATLVIPRHGAVNLYQAQFPGA